MGKHHTEDYKLSAVIEEDGARGPQRSCDRQLRNGLASLQNTHLVHGNILEIIDGAAKGLCLAGGPVAHDDPNLLIIAQ